MINISLPHKNFIKSFDSSTINTRKNSAKITYGINTSSSDSLNNSTSNNNQQNEFDAIIKLMLSETESNITRFDVKLNFYIRKHSKIKNDIVEKLITTLNSNVHIYYRAIIKCINTLLELLIENFQIINLLNNTIPFVLIVLFQEDNIKNMEAIYEINKFLGKLINKGNTNISGLIEEIVDTIFLDIFNENPNDCNMYSAYILLLCEIMKNSPVAAFNSIIMKNGIENFTKLFTICFKNKNYLIREISGDLTTNFINMLLNRDSETKKSYMSLLYFNIFRQYEFNVKLNNTFPNNYFLVSGFLLFLKNIFLSYPMFFNDEILYIQLSDKLMKCRNCGKNETNIKIDFINFIPVLYQMNKTIFKKKYLKEILENSNEILNKETNLEIKNNLLQVLGILNFYEYDIINKICSNSIISLLQKLLLDKNSPNDKVLKCLADFLNNKKGLLSQSIISMIDVFNILPKILKTPLNEEKNEFLISLINYYNYCSMENITVITLCLNTISLIICKEEFKMDNFLLFHENCNSNLINPKLSSIKLNIVKDLNKHLSDNINKDKNNKNYLEMITNALNLFSNIKNTLFYKDMFLFYNYKLLPLLKVFPNNINNQIIRIALCDFVKIYNNDENMSEFIINNIIDSILNIIILKKDHFTWEEINKVFENQKIIVDILIKEKDLFFPKIFNMIESSVENESKALIVKILGILEKHDENKGIYIRFIGNYIETLIFEIYNSRSSIFEEISLNFLFHLAIHFKHIFTYDIIEKILNISILITTRYEYKDIIIINALKIIIELLSIENFKNNDYSIMSNIIYIISLKLLKECNINDYLSQIVLELIYQIIKKKNIDIYSQHNLDIEKVLLSNQNAFNYYGIQIKESIEKIINFKKIVENINVMELLFNHLIKGENYNNSVIIMKILGLCGAISPTELEKFYLLDNEEYSDENYEEFILEDEELQIKRFNKLARRRITLNFPYIEPSNTKAVISLMEILKYYTQKDLKIKIILNLQVLIQSISSNQSYFINIILPTIIKILPVYEYKYQIILLQNISLIISNFKEKGRPYLDEILELIDNYIKDNYLEAIYKLFTTLFENYEFEMTKYYEQLIPKFIKIMKSEEKENISYTKLLILISKSDYVYPYIKLILLESKIVFLKTNEPQFINVLFDLLKQIISRFDTYIYYPLILLAINKKLNMEFGNINYIGNSQNENRLKHSKTIINTDSNILLNKFLEVLKIMNDRYRRYFISFLPKIIKGLNASGLIEYGNCRQKLKKIINGGNNFIFMYSNIYIKKISLSYCNINCHIGFNPFTTNKNEVKKEMKKLTSKDFEEYYNSIAEMDVDNNSFNRNKKPRGSFAKKKLNNVIVKNRRGLVNNEIIIKSFDNHNCKLEKDWNEWFKLTHKSLYEQNPSNFLYIFYLITEYYFSLNLDLTTHAFYSVYINNSDANKKKLTEYLDVAIKNPKTPDEILLSILNLFEFMERKNINMPFIDYTLFGYIAYKCKAFAKALYYKEKSFENNLDIDNLIDLYYKLNVPENGEGLIKLIETRKKYQDLNRYDKKYIWYINMHDYSKALKIINTKLIKEKDKDKINNLKKYKNICLNGLCDWENILSENESLNNNLENNYIIKENDIKEINEINEINEIISSSKDKINSEKDINISPKELIEKNLLLLKCCADLGEWDKLSEYMNEINEIFLEKEEKELMESKKERENKDLKEKNDLPIEKEKKAKIPLNGINKESNIKKEINYIPYNDIVSNNNKFEFLKYDDSLFDLNIYASISYIKKNNYEVARKYVEDSGKLLINSLKFLIKESYSRGYNILMKNQYLRQLEQFIEYKQYHSEDTYYFEQMKKRFKYINQKMGKIPEYYLKAIVINSLIFPLEEEYYKYIELSNIYRKSGKYEQSEIILNRLKEKMKLKINEKSNDPNILLDEKRIKIELTYNKCLFEKGNINEAVENGKYLIELLNDEELTPYNKLNNNIKGKIYGNYAIYRIKQLILNYNNSKISRQKSETIRRTFFRHKTNYLSEHKFFRSLFKKTNSDKIKQSNSNQNKPESSKSLNLSNSEKKNLNNKEIQQYQFIKNINEVNIINHYLTLATQYNPNSYKYWNSYALFNYKCYKFLTNDSKIKNDDLKEDSKQRVINYAFNAVNGLKHSLLISNKNKVKTLQDSLRFIDIFFELGSKNKDLLSLIDTIINESNVEIFIGITPQLFCRLDIKDIKVLEVLVKLLIKLFINFPQMLIFPLIVIKNSKRRKDKSIANFILNNSFKKNEQLKELYIEYEEFINELNKCSILNHEEWTEAIEISSKLFLNKDYNGMINQLIKMHNKMKKPNESLYEINFSQQFGTELKEAEKYINKLLKEQNVSYLKEAWEIYQSIYKRIGENYSKFQSISLQYISSKLFKFRDSNIMMPGSFNSYYYNLYKKELPKDIFNSNLKEFDLKTHFKPITIQRIEKYLEVVNSKQHPRKTSMIGSDSKEYLFLLKGHEDLRQDERVIQIFNLVNLIMAKEKLYSNKNLFITVYSVIPLSHKSGLIGWVHNCDTLNRLIKEQRAMTHYIQNIEHNILIRLNPKYESSKLLSKVEIFHEILKETPGDELQKIIWIKSKSCESWFLRTTNYSRSLAVMSILGYILGLGDRHLNNLLMSRKNGQIVHIDFGDCFEVAMKRDKYPEKVPFRLTRMLVKALGITEIEGNFRITCEKMMSLLINNKDSLMAILSALIHNPLISFRLMIPMIIKKQKNKKIVKNYENDNKSNSVIDDNIFKNTIQDNDDFSLAVKKIINKNTKNNSSTENLIDNSKEPNKDDETGESQTKDERRIMENEQRQIFNLYEENDEFDSEELYKIAQIVLNRINDKLNGMDFYPDNKLDEKEQVDKLIRQARSIENLAQSYLGWCPFW